MTSPIDDQQRRRFDLLLQDAIDALPPRVLELLDHVPVVVLDQPTQQMIRDLRSEGVLGHDDDGSDLCGLHTGIGITERSIEDPLGWGPLDDSGAPEQIHLFRRGIFDLAAREEGDTPDMVDDDDLYEEIRVTLLHEIGHHFGLDEDDLEELGYA